MDTINELDQEKKLLLRTRIWIEDEEGKVIMGEGRAVFLELIDRTGSINKAAKKLGMSYRALWGKLKVTEKALGFKFLRSEGRAGSFLTPEGKQFLENYLELKKRCTETDNRLFREIFYPEKKIDRSSS
jgi:molybdate transport system regulatory protein